jgi:hypothetical protein
MTTPADELRAAAKTIRRHATAAESKRPGRWYPGAAGSVICPRKGGVDYVTPHTIPDGAEVARYIAVMGPDVGHALADLLDDQADGDDEGVINPWALAVARALNGDAR